MAIRRKKQIAALVTPPPEAWPTEVNVWRAYAHELYQILRENDLGRAEAWDWDPDSKRFYSFDEVFLNLADVSRWHTGTDVRLSANVGTVEFRHPCDLDPSKPLDEEIARLKTEKEQWLDLVNQMTRALSRVILEEVVKPALVNSGRKTG